MRTAAAVVLPVVAFVTVAGCVSRVGPPASLPSSGETSRECTATDVEVTGEPGEEPEVTLPGDCTRPTDLLTRDLVRGDGPTAAEGSDLTVNYVMLTWSDGKQRESTWDTVPFAMTDLGDDNRFIKGWNTGLLGIREGGRRLLVIPPADAYGSAGKEPIGPDETVVFVVDAVTVSG